MPRLGCWFIRASFAYLIAGFTLGALMLTLKALAQYGLMRFLLGPHLEFLLIGWTVQLTMGVAFWMLPRFNGGSRGRVIYAWLAFVLLNFGVIAAALGPSLAGIALARPLGRAAEAGAAVAFAIHAWPRVRRVGV
jgi:hypothetical protein